jgi:hypothetical protein
VRRIRLLAAIAVLTGIGLGATADDAAPRDRAMAGGYTVLAGDFHVHSFPDGLPPWDAVREARRRRLDTVALTSHNSLFSWWMWRHAPGRAGDARGLVVLPGEELTSAGYHMAIVGLSQRIAWRQPIPAAIAAAHAQGAVGILSHPSGRGFRRDITDEGLAAVDGIEVAHPLMEVSEHARQDFPRFFARAIALKPKTAAIGSSDFHYFAPVGLCRTYLFVREPTAAGVLDALRAARTVACDALGHAYGPADLVPLVAARCRDDAAAPPVGDTRTAAAGTVLAWAGLLVLVLAGASDT